ncbi:two-component sensor kinase SA14-24 [Gracilibacillus boraciitolerans JCM 21714]|uniref:histidine kinase n=1 Tax=Gracilibacillus boraciitolerans JCM 21714 TaxID=1298598 RepID=W4VN48_9BACI|nr:ATP-binding protein [Gracilibacillus boraciitolerans]GAE94561.1 two-component sensor kinase SA14-24 [Gracilibacillus boraciitolerans JCM 21714]
MIVVTTFVLITSWALYNTACYLIDDMPMESQKQVQFQSALFDYLLLFSLFTVVIGSILHFYLTRKLIRPLRELIQSTQRIKEGLYPNPIQVHTNDEMGQLISHFNQLTQRLEANQTQRQRIVSDLSHEFRTPPLSNLNGYLSALKTGMIDGDPKLYQSLLDESKRLTKLIEQMEQLKEWDVESDLLVSRKEHVNIAVLVEQSIEMFRWLLNKEAIPYEIKAEKQQVEVNIQGVIQVMSNLLDNSIRYYQENGPIIIKGECVEKVYKISITGEGGQQIPLTDKQSIFERFYRVDHSRSRVLGGSGLGLAISKEIVERHNGKIGMISNGNLHTFWFTIPI